MCIYVSLKQCLAINIRICVLPSEIRRLFFYTSTVFFLTGHNTYVLFNSISNITIIAILKISIQYAFFQTYVLFRFSTFSLVFRFYYSLNYCALRSEPLNVDKKCERKIWLSDNEIACPTRRLPLHNIDWHEMNLPHFSQC